jgi:hypothetical protein
MVFYEEPRSRIEKIIGRRFPLAVGLLVASCSMAYVQEKEIALTLTTILATVITGYFRDIDQEKQTIKIVEDETALAYQPQREELKPTPTGKENVTEVK